MSSIKVSALTAKTTPAGTEELLINDSGVSKKITIDNVTENNFTDTLKSKLDAIEASATADQTGAEIKTAYQAEANAYTDTKNTKLSGIATSANNYVHPNHSGDVTSTADGATVISAGAVDIAMLSATGTAGATNFLRGDNTWVVPTDTNTTYTSSDFTHDDLTGFVANEHIDWTTDQGATNIHAGNYTDTNTTYSVGDGGLTQKNFTTADNTKLDGIEALADVTDVTNVTAAGALMDSEVTNLAAVKAFATTDYATAAQGTTADAALPKAGGAMTGAITTNSTFDGRDVATDGTKLDGIETAATADQTNAEIKTAYEANADTNEFSDAEQTKLAGIETAATADQSQAEIKTAYEANTNTNAYTDTEKSKLAGVESGADVTDSTNVASAGAVMESDTTTTSMSFVIDQDDMSTDSATKVPTQQSVKAYVDSQVQSKDTLGELGGNLDDITDGTTYKKMSATEQTKLSGIEASANNYTHPTGDGNKHVPANSTTNNGKVLTASGTAGNYTWETPTSGGISNVVEDTTPQLGGNLDTQTFTVDGRDVSTDGAKLDGIETGATADQTQSDINALGITATGVDLGNWTLTESAGVLYFASSGTNKAKLDASGDFTVTGDVISNGTV